MHFKDVTIDHDPQLDTGWETRQPFEVLKGHADVRGGLANLLMQQAAYNL